MLFTSVSISSPPRRAPIGGARQWSPQIRTSSSRAPKGLSPSSTPFSSSGASSFVSPPSRALPLARARGVAPRTRARARAHTQTHAHAHAHARTRRCARLPPRDEATVLVALAVGVFDGVGGLIATLDDGGAISVLYLGTAPPGGAVGSTVDGGAAQLELDPDEMDAEWRALLEGEFLFSLPLHFCVMRRLLTM